MSCWRVLLHSQAHHTLLTDVRKCVMSVSVGVKMRIYALTAHAVGRTQHGVGLAFCRSTTPLPFCNPAQMSDAANDAAIGLLTLSDFFQHYSPPGHFYLTSGSASKCLSCKAPNKAHCQQSEWHERMTSPVNILKCVTASAVFFFH